MAMDSGMAQAFQGGSGIDPSAMKVVILSLTGSALMLLFGWIATQLWQAWQDDHIKAGEFIGALVWLAAVITALIAVLGWY